jgi:hypothetical protein
VAKKPQAYPLRYAEDFFDVSNEVAVEQSKCVTGNHFSPPCRLMPDIRTVITVLRDLQLTDAALFILGAGSVKRSGV